MLNLKITGPIGAEVVPDNAPINTESSLTVLLMGTTGSGKSSFIECIANNKNMGISGDQLDGATQQLTVYKIQNAHLSGYPTHSIYIIDTVGFSDRRVPESKSLRMVQEWMKKTGCDYIDRILYFDRISDPRMAGSKAKVLALFKAISGEKMGRSVTFVTTMWNTLWKKEQIQKANRRYEELSNVHYTEFLRNGSRVVKFQNNHTSALRILYRCLAAGSDDLFGFEHHMLGSESGLQNNPTSDNALVTLLHTNLLVRRDSLQRRISDIKCDLGEQSTWSNPLLVQVLSEEVADLGTDLNVVHEELEVINAQTVLAPAAGHESKESYTQAPDQTSIVDVRNDVADALTAYPKVLRAVLALLGNYPKAFRFFIERKMKGMKSLVLYWLTRGILSTLRLRS